ncbi:helix-turn-helix transcriptional regulator [Jannaschia sp. CCS1]|uniref:helix-turn-helix transcriptional regulator n=1 Tax=Jannaschia sp. (strain CCS1) TaxID=290400 RepID=UPI000053BE7B|nr:helix-turn-helix transcriptional regulator [Jannaschia sp. CCS1]ABD55613.1 transcriptional regulator, XRE family [Jannaschia sp. CCS1]
MADPTLPPDDHLTGSRIRERRLAMGLKQGVLAEIVGVSPSYLNLIEHNHRKIGGKLLLALARALEVEASALTEGVDAGISELLDAAARALGDVPAETARVDELVARFPGWTALIAAQETRARNLEAQIEALRDRLAHDPALAEAMHEVLSSVAAIRTTADILVREADLDPAWRGRFHRNLHEDAERLSSRATGLLAQFEAPGAGADVSAPEETVEAMFEAAGHYFAEIEQDGADAVAAVLARSAGMEDGPARSRAEVRLRVYADDAKRLPMATFAPRAKAVGYDPARLVEHAAGDVALVLRRMASLPADAGPPPCGLAICDASGAMLHRRGLQGFAMPRVAAGCPLWPLYRVLGRVGQADMAIVETPQGARFKTWAVAQPVAQGQVFGAVPRVEATMLVMPAGSALAGEGAGGEGAGALEVIAGGPGCGTCPRAACAARR